MSLKEKIANFIDEIKNDDGYLPYLYNDRGGEFDRSKDWVYYSGPVWSDDEPIAAIQTFLTGKWLVSGRTVSRFEHEFSKKNHIGHSLMVNSGSSANLVMIAALKKHFSWQDNDEIIVSPVGFPTTIAPLIQNNLVPRFIDIEMKSLNFDLDLLEKEINQRTKGIFISPVLGNPPDMDCLKSIAEKHKIKLILDGCDSLGTKWEGENLSDFSVASSCSFYPAHHITTGEGGMVSSNDESLITLARSLAWWGRDCYCVGTANLNPKGTCGKRFCKWLKTHDDIIDHKYYFTNVGYNLKPLDMQGAIGLEQLKKIDEIHALRRKNKDRIGNMLLSSLGEMVTIPGELEKAETSWFGVPIICNNRTTKQALVKHFEENRIQTRNYFSGNILQHDGYSDLDDYKKYPLSNQVLERVFFIGCHPCYTEGTFGYIEEVVKNFELK
ncbi:MAG: DegT/DnrJ/EryC1/StrS family aminotransferase [Oligoflexales bacterium]